LPPAPQCPPKYELWIRETKTPRIWGNLDKHEKSSVNENSDWCVTAVCEGLWHRPQVMPVHHQSNPMHALTPPCFKASFHSSLSQPNAISSSDHTKQSPSLEATLFLAVQQ
jgi:hypothetical protein